MTFNYWVKHIAWATNDPEGDLITDFRISGDILPENYKDIRRYLKRQHACKEALEAFVLVYDRYKIFLKAT